MFLGVCRCSVLRTLYVLHGLIAAIVACHYSQCFEEVMSGEGELLILDGQAPECPPGGAVGGKARNLWLMGGMLECRVPEWFCITTAAFNQFCTVNTHTHTYVHMRVFAIGCLCILVPTDKTHSASQPQC